VKFKAKKSRCPVRGKKKRGPQTNKTWSYELKEEGIPTDYFGGGKGNRGGNALG